LHPLGLELYRQLEAVGRQELVVKGPVDPRGRVRLGAILLELAIEDAGAEVFGLAEHEVLKEVREPRLARPLVTRAYAKPAVVGDDGGADIHEHEHREPVAQAPALEGLDAKGLGSLIYESRSVAVGARVRLLLPRAPLGILTQGRSNRHRGWDPCSTGGTRPGGD
jgi:hypothetical protein